MFFSLISKNLKPTLILPIPAPVYLFIGSSSNVFTGRGPNVLSGTSLTISLDLAPLKRINPVKNSIFLFRIFLETKRDFLNAYANKSIFFWKINKLQSQSVLLEPKESSRSLMVFPLNGAKPGFKGFHVPLSWVFATNDFALTGSDLNANSMWCYSVSPSMPSYSYSTAFDMCDCRDYDWDIDWEFCCCYCHCKNIFHCSDPRALSNSRKAL